jgi:hypothetical membrane protein
MNNLKISGLLFYLSGAIVLMGIITAEAMYPSGYTTFKNEISDLGATRQPNSVSFEPSSSIFNTIMWLSGLMILTATFYQHKYFKKLLFTIPAILFGLGLFGVGIFPGNVRPYHGMSAMLAFLAGGVSAVTSFKIVNFPYKYIGIVLGIISLTTWFMAVFSASTLMPYIGIGGIERWVAYPLMLWLTGIGGHLMNEKPENFLVV